MHTSLPDKRSHGAMLRLAGIALSACFALGACASHEPLASSQPVAAIAPTAAALPSWQDSAARAAVLKFVADVTKPGSPAYVPPEARIAVFDNDGTLWSEQPMPFQALFMIDQLKAAAPQHPEWKKNPAFKALMAHDNAALARNQKALLQLLETANSGMTTDEYDESIRNWLASAKHPKFGRPYTDLVYQPQLELLDLLKASAPARIVSVASTMHTGGVIDFDNLQGEKSYGGVRAYNQSKLANVLFTYALARRLQGTGVTANCLHPGGVATGLGHNTPGVIDLVLRLAKPFLLTAERGAATSIYLASSADVEGVTGKYFAQCKPARSSAASHDEALQERLWALSLQQTGSDGAAASPLS